MVKERRLFVTGHIPTWIIKIPYTNAVFLMIKEKSVITLKRKKKKKYLFLCDGSEPCENRLYFCAEKLAGDKTKKPYFHKPSFPLGKSEDLAPNMCKSWICCELWFASFPWFK